MDILSGKLRDGGDTVSDDMAAEQREPEDGPRWMAELRRLDGDGKTHTVVRIVTEDAPTATAALHAAAERRLIAALDEANAPHVVSPGGHWKLIVPDEPPPVVSPGGSGPGETIPETGPGSPESAEHGSPRGTDTSGASGGAQGAVMLRADGEPMQRRPRSRTVSGQTVTNSYLHAINEGNRMTLGGVNITPREIQVVFVDGRFEKMILVGWRGAGVVWTHDCGWELPEYLRELTDPAQCDVETVMERRERRIQAMAGPPPVVSGAEIFHAALDAAADRVVDLSDLARKAANREERIDDTL
jgi:hypothetical protein